MWKRGYNVHVMESLEHAMLREAPIYAEYLGGAATCDAHHLTRCCVLPASSGFVSQILVLFIYPG
jgi:3-oxoacyl-(acyl-carrier-protein) synthase